MTATLISAAQLKRFAPGCNADLIAPHLDASARRFGIDTPRELRHWLSTLCVESQGFTRLEENLNYSVQGLLATFGRHRISAADCEKFGRKKGQAAHQNAIANIVYGGPFGVKNLGNTMPGDGYRYRGSGPIQTTGRANFRRAGTWCGVDFEAFPDKLRTWEHGAVAAGGFWHANGLNDIVASDAGEVIVAKLEDHLRLNEEDDVIQARRKVNGGTNGLHEVRAQLVRAAIIWGK